MRIRHAAPLAALALLVSACEAPTVPDLNNPTEAEYAKITDRSQLQAYATGILDGDRQTHGTQVLYFETIGRDLVRFDPAESRYITRLLGASLSNSDFIGNSIWTEPYRVVRSANLFITAVDSAKVEISAQEKSAIRGFARTFEALSVMRTIEARDTRGVPIETRPDVLVPIRCKPAVLAYVSALLDSAATDLSAAGSTPFPFGFPSGFAGFDTPATFRLFNRGLKAKVEMYRGFLPLQTKGDTVAPDVVHLNAALAALDSSFYDPTPTIVSFQRGVYHTYAIASGETQNPLSDRNVFRANRRVIRDSVFVIPAGDSTASLLRVDAAEAGDLRIQAKIDTSSSNINRISGSGATNLQSRYLLKQPGSPTDRMGLLRNEELVLMRAEILWGLNRDAEALTLVNNVRQVAGLGSTTFADHRTLLRGILKEKRYSLLFESPSRMIDYRMFGILNELGRERGFNPITNFPIPNNEAVARNQVLTCTN